MREQTFQVGRADRSRITSERTIPNAHRGSAIRKEVVIDITDRRRSAQTLTKLVAVALLLLVAFLVDRSSTEQHRAATAVEAASSVGAAIITLKIHTTLSDGDSRLTRSRQRQRAALLKTKT